VYPTAECRIGPMGQVTTSKGGVRLLHGSTAVKIHSWLAMFASFGRTLAPGNGGRGGLAPLTSDDSCLMIILRVTTFVVTNDP
jgi:hypothetical protein